jgi:hypothetical protein
VVRSRLSVSMSKKCSVDGKLKGWCGGVVHKEVRLRETRVGESPLIRSLMSRA